MSFIFLDESGDLGFNNNQKGSSNFFVITLLFVKEKRPIEKVISKIYSEIKKKHKVHGGVLHCYNQKPELRVKLLKNISSKNISVMCIYLDKNKVYRKLKNERIVIYNFITNILLNRIIAKKLISKSEKIQLIASRKETSRFLNENFKSYLSENIKNNHEFDLQIIIKTPHEEKCLQAVDFISWAIFRKFEYKDESYYNLIKEFSKLSGIPILINTSFNMSNEPIVCTPFDAYMCMMRTAIDFLVMDKFLIKRADNQNDILKG